MAAVGVDMCCSAARSLSPHLKVTCSLPCCSSWCCWSCNIWPQSSCGSGHPSCCRLPVGPVMRGRLLGWEHRNRQSGPEESLVAPDWPCAQTSRRGGVRCEAQGTARPHAPRAGPRLSFYSVLPCISLFGAPGCSLHVPTPPADRRPAILRSRCPEQGGPGEQKPGPLPAHSGPHVHLHYSPCSLSAHCRTVVTAWGCGCSCTELVGLWCLL